MIAPSYVPERWTWLRLTEHGIGPLFLLFDWYFNQILIERRHWVLVQGLLVLYTIELVSLTKLIDGHIVYDFAHLTTALSWTISLSIGFAFSLVHVLLSFVDANKYADTATVARPALKSANSDALTIIIL